MNDHAVPPQSPDVEQLKRMCARISAGDPPPPLEIEQALESGFGRLIGLEAELARTRAATAGPQAHSADDIMDRITELRDVLTELRTLFTSEDPPRIGYGFVLPGHHRQPGTSPARGTRGPSRN